MLFLMGNGPGSRVLMKQKIFEALDKIFFFVLLRFLKKENCFPGEIPRQSHELFGASLKNLNLLWRLTQKKNFNLPV